MGQLLNTTILRQERKGVDFLSPFYLQPWKHYIPVNYDFSNVEDRIHWAIPKKTADKFRSLVFLLLVQRVVQAGYYNQNYFLWV